MVTGAVRVSSSVRLHVLVGACSIVLSRLFNSAFSGSDYMTPSDRVINNSNFDIIWKKKMFLPGGTEESWKSFHDSHSLG